jgi:hypothetical protein
MTHPHRIIRIAAILGTLCLLAAFPLARDGGRASRKSAPRIWGPPAYASGHSHSYRGMDHRGSYRFGYSNPGRHSGWYRNDRFSNAYSFGRQNGYEKGLQKGYKDRHKDRRFDPGRHDAYRDADDGYHSRYGSKAEYRDGFRQGFLEGYREGYGRLFYRR